MEVRPCGDAAVLVDVADLDAALALHAALAAAPAPGVVDLVPAAATVLVRVVPGTPLPAVADWVRRTRPRPAARAGADLVELPAVYDGPDLPDVASHAGMSVEELVGAHSGQTWTVAFCGFAPGFGYLVGDGRWPQVPRRGTPRTRVPAGALAVAGEFTGVYPRESPGGWQLIGAVRQRMWDPDRQPAAILRPGVRVRFVDLT